MSQSHAEARIEERLTLAGINEATRKTFFAAVKALAPKTHRDSEAIRVMRFDSKVSNHDGGATSNGDEVWAIYRGQRLATVMLRRSTQPESNLRVAKVTRLA